MAKKGKEVYDPRRSYKKYSQIKSEVFRPFYKVRFEPGNAAYYCGENNCDVAELIGRRKELAWSKSTEIEEVRPYKVGYPGTRALTPYNLRGSTDPRLGEAKRFRDSVFKKYKISDEDDYSVSSDRGTWKKTDMLAGEEYDDEDDELEEDKDLQLIIVDPGIETTATSVNTVEEMSSSPNIDLAKRKKIYKHQLRNTCNSMVINESESLKESDYECAEAAVRFYNEQNHTDYEIVETLGSYSGLYDGVWYHCNFRARPTASRRQPKLFFAELFSKESNSLVVKDCKMLDGLRNCVRSCKICGHELLHPSDFSHGNESI